MTAKSSYTTRPACFPRPGSGGCFGIWDSNMWRFSTAACRNGKLRDARSKPGRPVPRQQRNSKLIRARKWFAEKATSNAPAQPATPRFWMLGPPRGSGAKRPNRVRGLRLGHMPGAINVPFTSLLNPNQTLKNPKELQAVLERAGFDFEGSAITSCGSGVAAAVVGLALEALGHEKHSLYDGSWSEWGKDGDTEVVVG